MLELADTVLVDARQSQFAKNWDRPFHEYWRFSDSVIGRRRFFPYYPKVFHETVSDEYVPNHLKSEVLWDGVIEQIELLSLRLIDVTLV